MWNSTTSQQTKSGAGKDSTQITAFTITLFLFSPYFCKVQNLFPLLSFRLLFSTQVFQWPHKQRMVTLLFSNKYKQGMKSKTCLYDILHTFPSIKRGKLLQKMADLSLSQGKPFLIGFFVSQNDQFAYLAIYQLYSLMAGHGGHDFKRISCIAM